MNSPTKPSKPARAYLHLTKPDNITPLSEHVCSIVFNDAKGTTKDAGSLGPPSVEFAPYGRVPNSRLKTDLRQGTIDQDQEFIDFLESLTNPIAKAIPVDQATGAAGKSKEKITVTPLVQFLKDKKTNKGKEVAAPPKTTKHARQDSKEKTSPPHEKKSTKAENLTVLSPDRRSAQAIKVEKAARDVVRVINRQANNKVKSPSASPTIAPAALAASSNINTPLAEKKRERGNISAAAKILQRDLGLTPIPSGRGGRRGGPASAVEPTGPNSAHAPLKQDATSARLAKQSTNEPVPNAASKESSTSSSTTSATTKLPNQIQPPRGPAALRMQTKSTSTSDSKSALPNLSRAKTPPVTPNATQAFLKHANPSQGITEPLLEEAFAVFGVVKKVEIDKKKGFGYVDFEDSQSLQDAIKASPIKVAQGQVVVLERKAGPALQARNARGGNPMNTRGGSPMMANRGGPPIGPRGGRGGSMRRGGGIGRGGANTMNPNIQKIQKPTDPSSSHGGSTKSAPAAGGKVTQASTDSVHETVLLLAPANTSGPQSDPNTGPI